MNTESIFAKNFLYVTLGVAFLQQGLGDLREFRGVFHAVGHVGAVEVRTQAHVINASHFDRMVDVLDDSGGIDARQFALFDVFERGHAKVSARRQQCLPDVQPVTAGTCSS